MSRVNICGDDLDLSNINSFRVENLEKGRDIRILISFRDSNGCICDIKTYEVGHKDAMRYKKIICDALGLNHKTLGG